MDKKTVGLIAMVVGVLLGIATALTHVDWKGEICGTASPLAASSSGSSQ